MKFSQLVSYAMAPAMVTAYAVSIPRELWRRDEDYVSGLLAEASSNTTNGNSTLQTIPKNGTVQFDHQGNPLPSAKYNYTVSPATYNSSSDYQRCVNAYNCEPVHHANGWRPSFKTGYNATHPYGNNTLSNRLTKRQAVPASLAGSADPTVMYYGNQNPCTAFNYAYYVCGETTCSSSESATLTNLYIDDDGEAGGTLVITAAGQYPSYNMRDYLIAAAVTAAGQGQTWTSTTDMYQEQLWTGTGLDTINVAVYDGEAMSAYMTIWVEWQNPDSSGVCGSSVNTITDVLKIFNSFWGNVVASIDTWLCQSIGVS